MTVAILIAAIVLIAVTVGMSGFGGAGIVIPAAVLVIVALVGVYLLKRRPPTATR